MADTIRISLSNVSNVKNVLIEGIGEFKVRQLGAGEELDLSSKQRRLNEIIIELQAIDLSAIDKNNPTEEEKQKLKDADEKAVVYMTEVNEIQKFKLETFKRCFDDGGTGKTDELINSLTETARDMLFQQIFQPRTLRREVQKEKAKDA